MSRRSRTSAVPTTGCATVDPEIAEVAEQLRVRLAGLSAGSSQRRPFLQAYERTTAEVGRAVAASAFEDPVWVRRWVVVFAGYFLAAHDLDVAGGRPPRPWRLAFGADPGLPPIVQLLLHLNAHLNYDLPRALLTVIDDADFHDPRRLQRRRRDHERIDQILASRVAVEGRELPSSLRLADRIVTPVNRWSSRRFLLAARRRAWDNVQQLHTARHQSPAAYQNRLADLDGLTSARTDDLVRPGPVLVRLALRGFGVDLRSR